jgi:glutathione S-transferase
MTSLKPITLYGHATGPNPWKVAMIFEELDLPYEMKIVPKPELKQPAYERICINGRAPAIEDPNTGITLWESGAIIEYLVNTYDKHRKLSFEAGSADYWHAKQWLYFQVSGQGPYFGQAVWFTVFHAEKIQSAQDRYVKEIHRVSGVLNRALEGKDWLVGNKYSFADVSFLTWYEAVIARVIGDTFDIAAEFPNLKSWLDRMRARPAVASVLKAKSAAAAANK